MPRRTDAAATAAAAQGPLLDRPISRTEYELGPGDVISVYLFGDVTDQVSVPISPDGTAVIPTIGSTQLLGVNLNEAERRVRALVNRLYTTVEVRVTLERVRSFKVFVLGNLSERGVRTATAATRVSEVLPAGPLGSNRRNVMLRRANGDSIRLDLVRFLQTGDLSANPFLREGDALIVPVLDRVVNIQGRVAFPASYEYREGESLADLLRVANGGGGFLANAADTIHISRFDPAGTREDFAMTQAEASGARGAALILRPFDGVYIAEVANFRQQRTAIIRGQVRFPGTYPIRPDTTTLREFVAMAGWLTPEASLAGATLQRPRQEFALRQRELETIPDSALTPEERQVRELSARSIGASFVVLDFEKVLAAGGAALDIRLQNGDVVHIPRRRDEVTVSGAVLRPGVVPYTHGQTFAHYIQLAGGFSVRADRPEVTLVRGGQGNSVAARDVWYVQAGDQVLVPFKTRRPLLERVQTVSGVATTLTTAILGILALTRVF